MSSGLILRVKRHRTDDPSDVIVVRPKKRRAEEKEESEEQGNNVKIMKLAGTCLLYTSDAADE